ncbi:putative filamentation protein [Phaeomoniella chlamydospora]|uniref:Putative filamentation protein n=1 Tax=Phaeomoniella chlamydospora TaxID=158046 RepID=A0A0G2EU08_PHACM|nr:putative filamentation protein [Phaeomoniella chlamydospora]
MSVRERDKAQRYIDSLDSARCNGAWNEVPEYIRKVRKHAPSRNCLITTATAEYQVATFSESRPSTSSSTLSTALPSLIPDLLSAIDKETEYLQDRLQAQTCLAWIHWNLAEPALAASRLPKDYSAVLSDFSKETPSRLTGWTEVCLIKGACLKGTAQSQAGHLRESLETFQSLLPWITSSITGTAFSKQRSYWTDQFLAQLALVASKDEEILFNQRELALQAFRHWAIRAQKQQNVGSDIGFGFVFPSQPQIWKAYFQFLSRLIQKSYEYPDDSDLAPKLQQYVEYKRVESMYENVLMKTVRFPKAHDSSLEIEGWVEQVIRNWRVLCGPQWTDEELGQGGKNAVGRVVLDVLYRAATKTFHSTLVLRRLFQVHKSLAEFDLAYKALDTYIEIVKRGRAKAEKAGEPATDIDDEETIVRTLSEGIDGLCCFGSAEQAEKANDIADLLDEWIGASKVAAVGKTDGVDDIIESQQVLEPADSEASAIAHRSIGIAQAQWARYTPFSEDRSAIRKEAISHLESAIAYRSPAFANYESYFALGLLLAETRDLDGAVQYVKEALTSTELAAAIPDAPDYERERQMIPLWHLLALVLSGRQDYETAERACEGALRQFPSPATLFGTGHHKHINGTTNEKRDQQIVSTGLVDKMDALELERLLEIRMTEIALTEVVEGPEIAVNSTNELLSLFARLFGRLGINLEDRPPVVDSVPPKTSAGTIKSFRGSIFSRRKAARSSGRQSVLPDRTSTIPEKELVRSPSAANNAPAIQVTDENQRLQSHNAPPMRRSSSAHHKLQRREGSINRKLRERSMERANSRPSSSYATSSHRPSFETGREGLSRNPSFKQQDHKAHTNDEVIEQSNGRTTLESTDPATLPPPASATAGVTESPTAKQELPEIAHNNRHDTVPPPPGHKDQPPEQDIRLPSASSQTQPSPQFTDAEAQKRAIGILVKIWLLIASLYRRATMFEDSSEAISEAQRHSTAIEALTASTQGSSAKAFADPGWNSTKSSDELMADIYAERGLLSLARTSPHEAIDHFEQALIYLPHHGKATVALATILLDIYAQKIPAERFQSGTDSALHSTSPTIHPNKPLNSTCTPPSTISSVTNPKPNNISPSVNGTTSNSDNAMTAEEPAESLRKTPSNLNRLAARDRAYGLLAAYTKLGAGWDDSEAWFTLARAYEESSEIDKAREVLWWCVELEDTKPIRHWRNLGSGGYVL